MSNSPFVEPIADHSVEAGLSVDVLPRVGRGIPRLTPNEHNDYLIDRELQRAGNYACISGIGVQHKAISESMGPIVDCSKEHLTAADLMLARGRRSLLKALAGHQRDGTVSEVLDRPTFYKGAMGGGGVLERSDQDPFEYCLGCARQAGLDPTILRWT